MTIRAKRSQTALVRSRRLLLAVASSTATELNSLRIARVLRFVHMLMSLTMRSSSTCLPPCWVCPRWRPSSGLWIHTQSAQSARTICIDVPRTTVAYIQEHADVFPNVTVEQRTQRSYPQGEACCHLLGYTGTVTEDQINASKTSNAGISVRVRRHHRPGWRRVWV